MNRSVARLFGVVLVLVGVLGFLFPSSFGMASTMFVGTFEVNVVHNLVHVLVGVWGLAAARTPAGATAFCKQAGVLFLLLAVLGFIPATVRMLANLVPIGGNDAYLHLVLAVILLYFGYVGTSRQAATA